MTDPDEYPRAGAPARLSGPPGPDRFHEAMGLALREARLAPDHADVPVGALVVTEDGTVLGLGHNERERGADPTAHAEMIALRAAARRTGSWRLPGATLVVTLEPCTMCAGALVLARVDRLVYGAVDEKAGAVGSLWDVVRDRRLNHRPEVVAGIRADECGALLAEFFAARRRPAGR
ncbi:tRNA-adenosine deaminase [Frankia casuarinae]|jgi:tRNA(adenine34) deaminase|uniref:tRNA-specific adenosine deaminase n=2 Tax=Frankia TaxID=1854 RepID=Q2JGC5_FRACC|nr:tRNA-adenosine deaminase [Frankia casuarinae]ETA03626.1 tRNA-adenosine deaminase [Frankia sp. CcI6]KDA43926.1 tRNA-adenosine deaminase [Frankia sp. BMG5.23]KEZ37391.1 tRNA-adenosine deaminase [Frankia sp. CeD]EYT90368.1 tRNA-adenosine deaminase [Frankia casuarinae]